VPLQPSEESEASRSCCWAGARAPNQPAVVQIAEAGGHSFRFLAGGVGGGGRNTNHRRAAADGGAPPALATGSPAQEYIASHLSCFGVCMRGRRTGRPVSQSPKEAPPLGERRLQVGERRGEAEAISSCPRPCCGLRVASDSIITYVGLSSPPPEAFQLWATVRSRPPFSGP
jgi:hypothetical protein